jgi:hypothetical protein
VILPPIGAGEPGAFRRVTTTPPPPGRTQVNGMQLADKIVFVGPFLKRLDRGEGREERFTNVYVKNLGDEVDDEGLKKLAGEHGPVTSAVVMTVGGARVQGAAHTQGLVGLKTGRDQPTSASPPSCWLNSQPHVAAQKGLQRTQVQASSGYSPPHSPALLV